MIKRSRLERAYLQLGTELEITYPELEFKSHCYWRMVNDCACAVKWDTKVKKPFYKNATDRELQLSVTMLANMLYRPDSLSFIHSLNRRSLNIRERAKTTNNHD